MPSTIDDLENALREVESGSLQHAVEHRRLVQGWLATVKEFDTIIGLARLAAVHVNDSRKGFHSRIDRHEQIGKGEIGLECFRMLMNDPRFLRIPKILETDKSDDMHEDVENLALLRSLVRP